MKVPGQCYCRPDAFLADQKQKVHQPEKIMPQFKIQASGLVFDNISESSNSLGEFPYSFLANGRTITERPIAKRESKSAGSSANLPRFDPVIIQSRDADDTFNFSEAEHDGEENHGTGIIEQAFTFKQRSQVFRHVLRPEWGNHRHGVSISENRTSQQSRHARHLLLWPHQRAV
jgi:hypothetical protein